MLPAMATGFMSLLRSLNHFVILVSINMSLLTELGGGHVSRKLGDAKRAIGMGIFAQGKIRFRARPRAFPAGNGLNRVRNGVFPQGKGAIPQGNGVFLARKMVFLKGKMIFRAGKRVFRGGEIGVSG